MSRPPLRLGTRKSPMAMAQSAAVASLITERTGTGVELVGLTSFGDVSQADLTQIGGTGVFVSALRECLLAGDIDLAVHSLKDLPTASVPGVGSVKLNRALTAGMPRMQTSNAQAATAIH